MKKHLMFGFAVIACVVALSAAVWAISPSEKQQLDNFKVSTLKGLPGVAVTVKIARDKENTLSLVKETDLQREVEIAFKKAGVEVLPPTADVGLYVVLVKVASAGKDGMECAVHTQSSLLQIVSLSRDSSIKTEAQTWPAFSQARFGVVSTMAAPGMIKQGVKDQANNFAEDYFAANPKTTSDTK
jgi:hypothetical protein